MNVDLDVVHRYIDDNTQFQQAFQSICIFNWISIWSCESTTWEKTKNKSMVLSGSAKYVSVWKTLFQIMLASNGIIVYNNQQQFCKRRQPLK